jgi:hypothetical protein
MNKFLLTPLLFLTGFVSGQNIFQDNFQNYNANAQLSGQGSWTNNSLLPGGLGTCTGFGCLNAFVVNQNVTATGYGSSTKALSLTPNTDGCGRSFTPFTDNGNLYVSMVINITNAQSTPQDFFRVLSGSNFTTAFRVLVQPTGGSTYSIGIRKGDTSNPTVFSTNSYNYGTDYLIILKYTQSAGTNDDTITLYANPNYGAGESGNTASATNFAGNDQSGNIDRLSFRQNAGPAGMPTGVVSMVSVARTWETLTFNLSTNQFDNKKFIVTSGQVKNGVLHIKTGETIENATLSVYDLQGRKIESKTISLQEDLNEVYIKPVSVDGYYIVEIISSDNQRFTQKILVK